MRSNTKGAALGEDRFHRVEAATQPRHHRAQLFQLNKQHSALDLGRFHVHSHERSVNGRVTKFAGKYSKIMKI
jgi:hypothetical protein